MKNGDINDIKYRRALISVLINKIYLYDDKATIIFNTQDRPVEITEDLLNDIEGSSEDNSAPPFIYILSYIAKGVEPNATA